jgi:hypothetical protein
MGLKERHIEQNMAQITKYQKAWTARVTRASLVDKIHWESNSLVKINPNIPTDKIIKKTTTDKFPANGITVRFQRMKDKLVTVYFYGESKVHSYGNSKNAMTWRSVDRKLHVTLPFERHQNGSPSNFQTTTWGYSFQGNLPDNFTLDDMTYALGYIKGEVDRMTAN